MKPKVDRQSGLAVIALPSRAIREASAALAQSIRSALKDGAKTVVFDLSGTEMMDSAALGVLIHARRENPPGQVDMVIRGAKGYVKGLLENAKFSALFRMEDDAA